MKNILLVTWFGSENYGTSLQAYATDRVLKNAGHHVCLLKKNKTFSLSKTKYFLKLGLSCVKQKLTHSKSAAYGHYIKEQAVKRKKIKQFVADNHDTLVFHSKREIKKADSFFDCYLVGSDQVWNPWFLFPKNLLDFVPPESTKPKYSYATSFGVSKLPEDKLSLYKKHLSDFKCITVREEKSVPFVKDLTGKDAEVVLDPTVLLTPDEWRHFAEPSDSVSAHNLQNYILCYFLGNTFDHLPAVKELSLVLKKQIVLIPMLPAQFHLSDPEIKVVADACPYDFVSLIDHADLICTDSFHATLFSLTLKKSFYIFPRFSLDKTRSHDTRFSYLVRKFNLSSDLWNEELTEEDVRAHLLADHAEATLLLEAERATCKQFLLDMVSGNLNCQE